MGVELCLEKNENKKRTKLDNVHKKISLNTTKIGNINNFENVRDRIDENINNANIKIQKNETALKNIQESLNALKSHFSSNLSIQAHLNSNQCVDSSNVNNGNPNRTYDDNYFIPPHMITPDETGIFNHDVLLFVDSNLKTLVANRINKAETCAKFYCPTLNHIDKLLDNASVRKGPKKIFVHCGTNHLHRNTTNFSLIEDQYISLLLKLTDKFPNAVITISSLLPRYDSRMYKIVQHVNDFLDGVCCSVSKFIFMRNSNIGRHLLVDEKHINNKGFAILLSNIRYNLFGEIPFFIPRFNR